MKFTKGNFFNEIRKKSVNLSLIRKFKTFVDITETENDTYKETALHHACNEKFNVPNRVKLIQYLLENDLDPNSKNSEGVTPFQLNLKNFDDPEITRVFMRYFSDVGFIDQNGDHFFHYTQPNNFVYLFEAFYELGLSIRAVRNNKLKEDQIDFIVNILLRAVNTVNNDKEYPFEGKDFSEALLRIKNVKVMEIFANRVEVGPLPDEAFENATLLNTMKRSMNSDSFIKNIKEEQLMRVFRNIDDPLLNIGLLKVLGDKFGPPEKFYMEALKNEQWETFYEAAKENLELLTGNIVPYIVKTTKDDNYILKILKLVDVSKVPKDEETGNNLLHQLVRDSNTKSLNYLERNENVFRELSKQKNHSGKKPQEMIVVREVVDEDILQEQQKLKRERQRLRKELKHISRKTMKLEEDNDDLEIEVRKRGKTIKEIDGLMKKHLQDLDEMQKKFEQEKLKKRECDTSELEKKILERENLIKTQRVQLQSSKSMLEKESGVVDELKRKIQQESKMLSKQESSIDLLTRELSKLRSELDISKKGNAELKSKIEENARVCQTNLEIVLKKNKETIETIRQENSRKQQEQQKLHTKEINELKEKIKEDLSEAEERKRSELESIFDKYQSKEEELIRELKEAKKNYQKKSEIFTSQIKSLREGYGLEKQKQLDEAKKTCEERVKKLNQSSEIQKEKDVLQNEIKRINQKHKKRVLELEKKMKDSKRLLQEEIEKHTNMIEQTLFKQKEKCQEKLESTEEEYNKKVGLLQDQFRREKASINEKNRQLTTHYNECEVKYKELAEKRKKEIEALERQVETTKASKDKEMVDMRIEHEKLLEEKKSQNDQRVLELELKIKEMIKKHELEIQREVDSLKKVHEDQISKLKEEQEKKIELLSKQIEEIKKKGGEMSELTNQLQKQVVELQVKHREDIRVLKKKHKNELERLIEVHKQKQEDFDQKLQQEKDKNKKEVEKLKKEKVEALDAQKKFYEKQLTDLRRNNKTKVTKLEIGKRRLEKSHKQNIKSLNKDFEKQKEQLTQQHTKKKEKLEEKIKELSEEAIKKTNEIIEGLENIQNLGDLEFLKNLIDKTKNVTASKKFSVYEKYIKKPVCMERVVIERPTLSILLSRKGKSSSPKKEDIRNLRLLNHYFSEEYPILKKKVMRVSKDHVLDIKKVYKEIIEKKLDMFVKKHKEGGVHVTTTKGISSRTYGEQVYDKISTMNVQLYSDLLTNHILEMIFEKEKKKAHHVYMFGRSGTGKTFFWETLHEKFIEKLFDVNKLSGNQKYIIESKAYLRNLQKRNSQKEKKTKDYIRIVKIPLIETVGHYAGQKGDKQENIKFTVFDKRDLRGVNVDYHYPRNFKTRKNQYSEHRDGIDFYNNTVKEGKEVMKMRSDIERNPGLEQIAKLSKERSSLFKHKFADLSNPEVVRKVLKDDRMEIKLFKRETGHYSTRNHIQKRIYIQILEERIAEIEVELPTKKIKKKVIRTEVVDEFELTFVIFAGSEPLYTDNTGKKRKNEMIFFGTTENLLPNVIQKRTDKISDKSPGLYKFIEILIKEINEKDIEPTFAIMVWPGAQEILCSQSQSVDECKNKLYIFKTHELLGIINNIEMKNTDVVKAFNYLLEGYSL